MCYLSGPWREGLGLTSMAQRTWMKTWGGEGGGWDNRKWGKVVETKMREGWVGWKRRKDNGRLRCWKKTYDGIIYSGKSRKWVKVADAMTKEGEEWMDDYRKSEIVKEREKENEERLEWRQRKTEMKRQRNCRMRTTERLWKRKTEDVKREGKRVCC